MGQAPNNNNNTATAASDNNYYLVCQQQVHTRNSTSESHWSTSSYRQKQRRTKKIGSKYFDWKMIRLVVLGLVSSISNDLGAAGEIICRVESTTQKLSAWIFQIWMRKSEANDDQGDFDTVCCWLYSQTIPTMTSNQIIETLSSQIRQQE